MITEIDDYLKKASEERHLLKKAEEFPKKRTVSVGVKRDQKRGVYFVGEVE